MAGPRHECDHIWQFRLENAGALPRQKSDDAEEASLGRLLARLRIRAEKPLGEGTKPSQKKLSSADKEYLRNTLVEPMPTATTAGVAGAGAHAAPGASTARKLGEKVLAWQAAQRCQRIPKPRGNEKSLGKSFQDVLRRRYCAIGEKPCQQQLSADDVHFINGIPGVPAHGCSVNTGARGVKGKRRRKRQATGAGATGAEATGHEKARQVVAKSLKPIWATAVSDILAESMSPYLYLVELTPPIHCPLLRLQASCKKLRHLWSRADSSIAPVCIHCEDTIWIRGAISVSDFRAYLETAMRSVVVHPCEICSFALSRIPQLQGLRRTYFPAQWACTMASTSALIQFTFGHANIREFLHGKFTVSSGCVRRPIPFLWSSMVSR